MAQTVPRYGKTSQQRMAPYIVISKRKLPGKAQAVYSSQGSFKTGSPEEPVRRFLLHVVGEDAQDALGVIEKICKSREQITASTTPMGGAGGVYVPYPIRVTVGGATVFVLEVSQFLKV